MILTPRFALVRNVLVSGTNGAITLIILLIAPLGLTAVIMNTALVTLATFFTSQTADRVVGFLQHDRSSSLSVEVLSDSDEIQERS
jgi:hypothetical protein